MRIIKWIAIVLFSIIALLFLFGWLKSESFPNVDYNDPQADQIAMEMLSAVNKEAWDSTQWVQWTFRSGATYLWDKSRDMVRVNFEEGVVLLHTSSRTGQVWDINGTEITDETQVKEWLDRAWSSFANDSFWLCAPMKAFDQGTKRGTVTNEDGSKNLMVTYNTGGVTPGDSYLWFLDENSRPKAWKMWVSIIPVNGMEFSWEDWQDNDNQPAIALTHHNSVLDVPIIDLALEDNISEVQNGVGPF